MKINNVILILLFTLTLALLIGSVYSDVSDTAEQASQTVSNAAGNAKDATVDAAQTVSQSASDAAESAKGPAKDAAETVKDKTTTWNDWAKDMFGGMFGGHDQSQAGPAAAPNAGPAGAPNAEKKP